MGYFKYTEKIVFNTLKNKDSILEQSYYASSLNSIDTLIDIDLLIKESNLTEHQIKILSEYYVEGYKMQEIADKYGYKAHVAVLNCINRAKERIRKVLEKWEVLDSGNENNI